MDETLPEALSNGRLSERIADAVDNMSIAYMAIAVGLAGMGATWRELDEHPPQFVSRWIQVAASVIWAAFVALVLVKGLLSCLRSQARS